MIVLFWTLSIFEFFNGGQCFGSQLQVHLQARKATNLLDPLDKVAFLGRRQKYGWIQKCGALLIS
jgi:hypothetical protein